jgi:Rieske Fe-S protein
LTELRRREVLLVAGTALLAGCGGGKKRRGLGRGWQRAGRLADVTSDGYTPRAVELPSALYGDTRPQPFYLRRVGDRVVALLARCTEDGCPVRYVQASRRFVCPCDGAVFDSADRPLGRAPRPLLRYPTLVRDGTVYVKRPYS